MLRICLSIFALAACLSVQALAQAAAPSAKPQAAKPSTIVNLNTATVAELETLPGIGAKVATRIVEDPNEERTVPEDRRVDERSGRWGEEFPQAAAATHRRDKVRVVRAALRSTWAACSLNDSMCLPGLAATLATRTTLTEVLSRDAAASWRAKGTWWAHLVGARSFHPDKHWPDYPAESDRGFDERSRDRREELSEAQTARHRGVLEGWKRGTVDGSERAGRGHASCPRPPVVASALGFTSLDIVFAGATLCLLLAVAIPQTISTVDRSRGLAAARYLAARVALARAQAVGRSTTVALRFQSERRGINLTAIQDGNWKQSERLPLLRYQAS